MDTFWVLKHPATFDGRSATADSASATAHPRLENNDGPPGTQHRLRYGNAEAEPCPPWLRTRRSFTGANYRHLNHRRWNAKSKMTLLIDLPILKGIVGIAAHYLSTMSGATVRALRLSCVPEVSGSGDGRSDPRHLTLGNRPASSLATARTSTKNAGRDL